MRPLPHTRLLLQRNCSCAVSFGGVTRIERGSGHVALPVGIADHRIVAAALWPGCSETDRGTWEWSRTTTVCSLRPPRPISCAPM
jgi:hypothetical protein